MLTRTDQCLSYTQDCPSIHPCCVAVDAKENSYVCSCSHRSQILFFVFFIYSLFGWWPSYLKDHKAVRRTLEAMGKSWLLFFLCNCPSYCRSSGRTSEHNKSSYVVFLVFPRLFIYLFYFTHAVSLERKYGTICLKNASCPSRSRHVSVRAKKPTTFKHHFPFQ